MMLSYNTCEKSKDEEETMTCESQNTVQMKLIKDLQEHVKSLHLSQQQLVTHMQSLEDTAIASSDSKNESVQCNRANKLVKKIKRKTQVKKIDCTDESDASEENDRKREHHGLGNDLKGMLHIVVH